MKRLVKKSLSALLTLTLSLSAFASNDSINELQKELTKAEGQVVFIDFWASWCSPCRKSFPWMNEMQEKYSKMGFKIISVNLDEDHESATKFLSDVPANFPVVFDPEFHLAKKFNVKGMPSSYFINRTGKLVISHVGFKKSEIEKYENQIKKLLSE
jgi:thiol-disulfide isomerase/thioredoxin